MESKLNPMLENLLPGVGIVVARVENLSPPLRCGDAPRRARMSEAVEELFESLLAKAFHA